MNKYNIFKRNYNPGVVKPGTYVPAAFIYSVGTNPDPTNYDDITNIDTWDVHGSRKYDYLFVRQQIDMICKTKVENDKNTYETLPELHQKIACQKFLVPEASRSVYYTDAEQYTQWKTLGKKAKECRKKRWELAKDYISYKLTSDDSEDLAEDTDTISTKYIRYGKSDLIDYIEGSGSYSGNGYPAKSYYTLDDKLVIINALNEHGVYKK